jgi:S1-C subfamily serine protease
MGGVVKITKRTVGLLKEGDLAWDSAPAAAALSTSIRGLLHQTQPSYVALIVGEPRDQGVKQASETLTVTLAAGSGFIVDSSGNVITAAHVAMREGSQVDARAPDGRTYLGKVVKIRAGNDVALIKLSGFSGAPVNPVGQACMRRGEAVFSLGKPYQNLTWRVSAKSSP